LKSFNDDLSYNFIKKYFEYNEVDTHVHSNTIAPSSLACERLNYYRIINAPREEKSDIVLNHSAYIGKILHEKIQSRLKSIYGEDYLDVAEYIKTTKLPYTAESEQAGLETLISIKDPPFKFACDALIRLEKIPTIIEIKSINQSYFSMLEDVADKHIDQISAYMYLLNVSRSLVLYVSRETGYIKCFTLHNSIESEQHIQTKVKNIMHAVETLNPPPKQKCSLCSGCAYKTVCEGDEFSLWD
jgi:CRISPR/Cas system-associated exonuclease Cas4 (RecB family)